MVIFGTPVLPDVGPSSATSSAAVSDGGELARLARRRGRVRSSVGVAAVGDDPQAGGGAGGATA